MCGRFEIDPDIPELKTLVSGSGLSLQYKTGEIFPADTALVLTSNGNDIIPASMIWGFPKWDGKGVIFNARSETAHEKPMFKNALMRQRIAIPTTGFYEWKAEGGRTKTKFFFTHPSENILWLAGIYSRFGNENRFTILTTSANDSMAPYHHRMPVLLEKEEIETWINGEDIRSFLDRTPHSLTVGKTI
ncbi:SOS response-associated peptidase [Oxalobacter formigenes]|uniref:Abasic site processing protein n=1 Tax=Oxalobacter formigenes OXCC13 TaxID=556269 RepID=C3X9W3_OXAFO|nr:SOS response-associated peptidase [Oxalobacter formigenes]ARQ45874.1 Putative SOS response-associated peptidase YedK [Oxalobacter formigenes]ARQ78093.1 DUF159 family protein [Oxalobacter formigenes OXCC13]EEO29989.1 hypothetical protein OFBG_01017 [Oxalobacter formigenes OXCC13]MCZ4062219.1 SOS response-associated peptidase [Oxalobacter formigenes]QDX33362.1 SOS response-associated peptidase [Oxalobacter formigenes]